MHKLYTKHFTGGRGRGDGRGRGRGDGRGRGRDGGGRGRGPPGAARGRGGGGADAPDFSSGKFSYFVFYMYWKEENEGKTVSYQLLKLSVKSIIQICG